MQLIKSEIRWLPKLLIGLILIMLASSQVLAGDPDCTGSEQYPASIAFGALKNAGLTDNYKVVFTKTKVTRLASEKIGKDLYRQVHYITFTEKSGKKISVITVNEVSFEECSMTGGQIFLVRELQ